MISIVLNKKKIRKKEKKNNYCLVFEKKTNNKNIKGVRLENKIGQPKSTCVDCGSRKSTFLKPIKPIKNKKWFLRITKHANLLQKLYKTYRKHISKTLASI